MVAAAADLAASRVPHPAADAAADAAWLLVA